jgi:antitoxin (DNA-binding transcriptional repressor) of toxin-antitoxin stability system
MKAVGVKQLKARLSEYVRMVKAGETLFVTEREEVVAEFRPARRHPHHPEELSEVLDALAESGQVTRASAPKDGWTWRSQGLGLARETVRALLDDLRADR